VKLYPLIYTNEAAPTPREALQRGIAAIRTEGGVLLVNAGLVLELANEGLTPDGFSRAAANTDGVVVGTVQFEQDADTSDLFTVYISAGANKFGPLAYQLVMGSIYPGWLRSGASLTPGSKSVWNKMYQISESGRYESSRYERKWLGEFRDEAVTSAMQVDSDTIHFFENLAAYSGEADTVKYIKYQGGKPGDFGFLWAYRSSHSEPKQVSDLFDKGKELLKTLPAKYADKMWLTGSRFFNRKYHIDQ
jgi:hypothetical protein